MAQAVANILAQLGGSCLAAGLLYGVVPNGGGSSLGSNASELAGWCTCYGTHCVYTLAQPASAALPFLQTDTSVAGVCCGWAPARSNLSGALLIAVSKGFTTGEVVLGEAVMTVRFGAE